MRMRGFGSGACLVLAAALGLGSAPCLEAARPRRTAPAAQDPALVRAKECLQALVQAYVEGDTEGFMRRVSRGFFGDDGRLRQSLIAERRDFSQVRLEIFIETQMVGREHTTLALSWNREMVVNATGALRLDRGSCRLVFKSGDGKLVDISGARPFGFVPP